MKVRTRNILGSVAVGALACSAMVATPAFAADGVNGDDNGIFVDQGALLERISGADRFGTAVAASKALSANPDSEVAMPRDTVILANYLAWSDTLAATPLSDAIDATVLYSYADKVESKTAAELDRLKAANGGSLNVLLIGGEGVLNNSIVTALEKKGFTVDRIGGEDRYETALHLAAEAVDHYEGTTRLADAREGVRSVVRAEAAYQEAVAAWEKARTSTNSALSALRAAEAKVEAAQKALDAAVAGIQAVPGAPTQAELNAAATELADANRAVSNIQTVEGFVSDRLVDYAAAAGTDFQDDTWAAVVAHFGATQFSVTLKGATGNETITGTLAQHSSILPYLSTAVGAEGTTPTVKAVQQNLADQLTSAKNTASAESAQYGALVEQWVAAQTAGAANEAQLAKVAAAQKALDAAQDAYGAASSAYATAVGEEQDAKDAVEAALATRPSGGVLQQRNRELGEALTAVLKDAKAYPAFLATGMDFADALAAGPAAAEETGVVLLTKGATLPDFTARYLAADPNQVAVGGPAAAAATKLSVKYVGIDRYETATKLAKAYFGPGSYDYVGLASGQVAADAVVAGSVMANVDGTLVLTRANELPKVTADFLSYEVDGPVVVAFGGPGAISNGVLAAAEQALKN